MSRSTSNWTIVALCALATIAVVLSVMVPPRPVETARFHADSRVGASRAPISAGLEGSLRSSSSITSRPIGIGSPHGIVAPDAPPPAVVAAIEADSPSDIVDFYVNGLDETRMAAGLVDPKMQSVQVISELIARISSPARPERERLRCLYFLGPISRSPMRAEIAGLFTKIADWPPDVRRVGLSRLALETSAIDVLVPHIRPIALASKSESERIDAIKILVDWGGILPLEYGSFFVDVVYRDAERSIDEILESKALRALDVDDLARIFARMLYDDRDCASHLFRVTLDGSVVIARKFVACAVLSEFDREKIRAIVSGLRAPRDTRVDALLSLWDGNDRSSAQLSRIQSVVADPSSSIRWVALKCLIRAKPDDGEFMTMIARGACDMSLPVASLARDWIRSLGPRQLERVEEMLAADSVALRTVRDARASEK